MNVLIVFVLVLAIGVSAQIRGRFLGGKHANPADFKYQVKVVVEKSPDDTLFGICGGSIIHNEWILSAAHCFKSGKIYGIYALLGYMGGTKYNLTRYATKLITHEGYFKGYTVLNDIALLKIPFVKYNEYIQKLSLSPTTPLEGQTITVAGWGLIDPKTSTDDLKYVMVKVINNTECERLFRKKIPPYQFCTFSPIQNACNGDSGSPAVMGYGSNAMQVGLVSYGMTKCTPYSADAYPVISSYIEWIRNKTQL